MYILEHFIHSERISTLKNGLKDAVVQEVETCMVTSQKNDLVEPTFFKIRQECSQSTMHTSYQNFSQVSNSYVELHNFSWVTSLFKAHENNFQCCLLVFFSLVLLKSWELILYPNVHYYLQSVFRWAKTLWLRKKLNFLCVVVNQKTTWFSCSFLIFLLFLASEIVLLEV